MKKFKVTLYQEIYSDYEIEAESLGEAAIIVFSGDLNVDPVDITVKESEIVECKEIV